jgi:hypothetical protein
MNGEGRDTERVSDSILYSKVNWICEDLSNREIG